MEDNATTRIQGLLSFKNGKQNFKPKKVELARFIMPFKMPFKITFIMPFKC